MQHGLKFPSRRVLMLSLLGMGAVIGLSTTNAVAFDENSTKDVNVDANGVALRGYDAVAYQTENKPVKGLPTFTAKYGDATFQFSSAANRDLFLANPARYAPAFGGFCAMGAAMGRKVDADPQLFRVVDNRLYLNYNPAVQTRWVQDVPGNIKNANAAWPGLHGKTPKQTHN